MLFVKLVTDFLQLRRIQIDLLLLFKIVNGIYDSNYYFSFAKSILNDRAQNPNLLVIEFLPLSTYQSFYDYRVVNLLNNLPVSLRKTLLYFVELFFFQIAVLY